MVWKAPPNQNPETKAPVGVLPQASSEVWGKSLNLLGTQFPWSPTLTFLRILGPDELVYFKNVIKGHIYMPHGHRQGRGAGGMDGGKGEGGRGTLAIMPTSKIFNKKFLFLIFLMFSSNKNMWKPLMKKEEVEFHLLMLVWGWGGFWVLLSWSFSNKSLQPQPQDTPSRSPQGSLEHNLRTIGLNQL